MVEVLSEYFSDDMKKKATVRRVQTELNKTTLFEVLWAGKSVGVYQTEQEADYSRKLCIGKPSIQNLKGLDPLTIMTCLFVYCLHLHIQMR